MATNARIRFLLAIVDQAYDRPSWHGPNLRGSIRGLRAPDAARRPAPGRHNIWEVVVHAAYWKYAAWRRLTGHPRASFALKGSNWFPRPQTANEAAWRDDVALLQRTHATLRDAIAHLPARELDRHVGKVSKFALIAGIAAHDLYHAGQIQLLKKLTTTPRRR